MVEVEIYTRPWCPYCLKAKTMLKNKGVDYREIDIDRAPQRRAEMIERSGGRTTVPQIFIDGRAIGGADDLASLERAGRLDALLKG